MRFRTLSLVVVIVLLFEAKASVSNFPNFKSQIHFFYGERLATAHYSE